MSFLYFVWFVLLVSYSRFVSQLWAALTFMKLVQLESGYVWFMMVINNQPETFELQTEFLLSAWLPLLILSLHFYPTLKQRAKCCITSKNKNNHLIKKDKRNKIKSKTMIEKQKLNPVWSWEWWWREGFSSVWRLVMRKTILEFHNARSAVRTNQQLVGGPQWMTRDVDEPRKAVGDNIWNVCVHVTGSQCNNQRTGQ